MTLVRYYLPGFKAGGPLRSIHNITAALRDDCDFWIITSDRDHGDPAPYDTVRVNAWNNVGAARAFYADVRHRTAGRLFDLVRQVNPDVIYLNTVFDPTFGIRPLLGRRLGRGETAARWIVAPRGEFGPGAMSLKTWKKRAFLQVARATGLFAGVTWQATSEAEVDDIRRETGADQADITVATNITEAVGELAQRDGPGAKDQPLKVCFVSRITPKKNLSFAVHALARTSARVEFNIYGPVEDHAIVTACGDAAAGAGNRLTVNWHGHVPHEQVRSIFAAHDLFLFPTLGENFGHVIFESLAAGTPVLVSDRTPWRDLDDQGVGWVRSLDRIDDFAAVIDACAARPADERIAMRRRVHAYARDVHRSSPAVEQTRRLLLGTFQS